MKKNNKPEQDPASKKAEEVKEQAKDAKASKPASDGEPEASTQNGQEQPEMITVEKAKLEAASKAFEEAKHKADQYMDQYLRCQADFDNYRKRNAALRTETEDDTIRKAVTELLTTVDNLQRALDAAKEDSPLKSGVEMTLRILMENLAKWGMESIPCEKGMAFDPTVHNAVMTMEVDEEHPADTIAEVFQKGYMVRGKAVRYAMVKVAKE